MQLCGNKEEVHEGMERRLKCSNERRSRREVRRRDGWEGDRGGLEEDVYV